MRLAAALRSSLPFGQGGALPLDAIQLPWFVYLIALLAWSRALMLQPRLVQLQVELQEADIGGVRQSRAMLGVRAAQACLAEGRQLNDPAAYIGRLNKLLLDLSK